MKACRTKRVLHQLMQLIYWEDEPKRESLYPFSFFLQLCRFHNFWGHLFVATFTCYKRFEVFRGKIEVHIPQNSVKNNCAKLHGIIFISFENIFGKRGKTLNFPELF